MASFDDISKKLAVEYANAFDKKKVSDYIISYINSLTYTDNNQPLSFSDKEKIVKGILKYRQIEKGYSHESVTEYITEKRDNAQYLQMVDYMLNQLKPKK